MSKSPSGRHIYGSHPWILISCISELSELVFRSCTEPKTMRKPCTSFAHASCSTHVYNCNKDCAHRCWDTNRDKIHSDPFRYPIQCATSAQFFMENRLVTGVFGVVTLLLCLLAVLLIGTILRFTRPPEISPGVVVPHAICKVFNAVELS